MRTRLIQLNQQLDDIDAQITGLCDRECGLTLAEADELKKLQRRRQLLVQQISDEQNRLEDEQAGGRLDANVMVVENAEHAAGIGNRPRLRPGVTGEPERWADQDGRIHLALGPQHSLLDYAKGLHFPAGTTRQDLRGSFGRMLRAKVTGTWKGAEFEREIMASGSTTDNTNAGYLVPNPVASWVIDLARAKSVLISAGVRVVPMDSSTLDIARVSDDPTVQVKGENDAFEDASTLFDLISLSTYTIGVYATFSRELIADAPNAPDIIEETFVKALASKFDYYGLAGSGSQEPLGIIGHAGAANTITSVGSPGWTDWLNAMKMLYAFNETPVSTIYSPATWYSLQSLLINSEAEHYATAPKPVADLQHLVTTHCPDANSVTGDFSQMLMGLRQDISVEVSTEAGDTFKKHQVAVKATLRGNFNRTRANAFITMTGIS